jgi:hypothetical protein
VLQLDEDVSCCGCYERLHDVTMANGEYEVVSGEQLSKVLKRWRKDYVDERNPEHSRYIQNQVSFLTPQDWLAQETGINERRIRGLINGEYEYVGLSQADAVLQAAGFEGWLYSVINVIPNPNWSVVDWVNHMSNRGCI